MPDGNAFVDYDFVVDDDDFSIMINDDKFTNYTRKKFCKATTVSYFLFFFFFTAKIDANFKVVSASLLLQKLQPIAAVVNSTRKTFMKILMKTLMMMFCTLKVTEIPK